jgi:hypothetical protein
MLTELGAIWHGGFRAICVRYVNTFRPHSSIQLMKTHRCNDFYPADTKSVRLSSWSFDGIGVRSSICQKRRTDIPDLAALRDGRRNMNAMLVKERQ